MRDHSQRTVVVAMIAMRVVQASIDQIVDMVPMGNGLMAACRAMSMRLLMSGSAMLRIAPIRICRADFKYVFVSVPPFDMF